MSDSDSGFISLGINRAGDAPEFSDRTGRERHSPAESTCNSTGLCLVQAGSHSPGNLVWNEDVNEAIAGLGGVSISTRRLDFVKEKGNRNQLQGRI